MKLISASCHLWPLHCHIDLGRGQSFYIFPTLDKKRYITFYSSNTVDISFAFSNCIYLTEFMMYLDNLLT
jgi:hypothetical protein